MAKLIACEERRGLPADGQPNLGNHLEGGYVNDVVAQRALDGNDFAQVTHCLTLWFEMVDPPQRIVIQGEFRGRLLDALSRFGVCLIGRTIGVQGHRPKRLISTNRFVP